MRLTTEELKKCVSGSEMEYIMSVAMIIIGVLLFLNKSKMQS